MIRTRLQIPTWRDWVDFHCVTFRTRETGTTVIIGGSKQERLSDHHRKRKGLIAHKPEGVQPRLNISPVVTHGYLGGGQTEYSPTDEPTKLHVCLPYDKGSRRGSYTNLFHMFCEWLQKGLPTAEVAALEGFHGSSYYNTIFLFLRAGSQLPPHFIWRSVAIPSSPARSEKPPGDCFSRAGRFKQLFVTLSL